MCSVILLPEQKQCSIRSSALSIAHRVRGYRFILLTTIYRAMCRENDLSHHRVSRCTRWCSPFCWNYCVMLISCFHWLPDNLTVLPGSFCRWGRCKIRARAPQAAHHAAAPLPQPLESCLPPLPEIQRCPGERSVCCSCLGTSLPQGEPLQPACEGQLGSILGWLVLIKQSTQKSFDSSLEKEGWANWLDKWL